MTAEVLLKLDTDVLCFNGFGEHNALPALFHYDIETADDIQEALKDLLGGTIKSMMESEMDEHLGYENYERSDNDNYRNGTKRCRWL